MFDGIVSGKKKTMTVLMLRNNKRKIESCQCYHVDKWYIDGLNLSAGQIQVDSGALNRIKRVNEIPKEKIGIHTGFGTNFWNSVEFRLMMDVMLTAWSDPYSIYSVYYLRSKLSHYDLSSCERVLSDLQPYTASLLQSISCLKAVDLREQVPSRRTCLQRNTKEINSWEINSWNRGKSNPPARILSFDHISLCMDNIKCSLLFYDIRCFFS